MARIAGKVEAAFGADLTANPLSWTWTDLSSRLLDGITLQFGRPDEASTTTPTRFGCRLKNADGALTPRLPTSTYYPYVRRQTPIRCSVNPGGTGYTQVFQGYIDAIEPAWPTGNSRYSEVAVTASGSLGRLGQRTDALRSAMYRAIIRSGPVAYWPLEDGPDAGRAASALPAGPALGVTAGRITFASATPPPSSSPLADFSSGGIGGTMQAGAILPGSPTTSWRMEFIARWNAISAGSFAATLQWVSSGGVTLWEIDAAQLVDGGLQYQIINDLGTIGGPFVSNVAVDDGLWHHIRFDAVQNGSNIDTTVKLDGTTVITQTLSSAVLAQITSVIINPTRDPSEEVPSFGHLAIWSPFSSTVDTYAAFQGYAGETAGARIVRLCGEEDVPVTVSSTTGTALMGPQGVDSFLALLRECEAADGGILYDGDSAGLTYVARPDRYNQAVTLALDTASHQVKLPFTPVEDDQRVANDWTVTRPGGSSAESADEAHVAANGRYRASANVNVELLNDLQDQASWRVHLGTVEEMRIPQLSLQLIDHSELWTAALALRPGDRLTVANPPTQYPPGTIDLIAEGFTAAIGTASWQVTPTCSPYAPWSVDVLDTMVLDCANSVLGTAMTTTSTSLDVLVSDSCLWSHASGNFSINVGGEQMTVTAVGSTTTPTPALVAVGTAGTGNAAPVTPGLPGGATAAGNLMLMLACVRDTNATSTNMYITGTSGWVRLLDNVNMALFAKVHNGAEVAPTLNYTAGIAGDTVIAQIASFTGKWGDPQRQLIAAAAQSNTAAQNIAYPSLGIPLSGTLAVWLGQKADDWTSVATLAGTTEISEATSTLGNDAGLVWDYVAFAGASAINAGSFTVTGGTSQVSRGAVVALRSVYQTLTVTRSVNGVVKAQTIGTPVSLWKPPVLAL